MPIEAEQEKLLMAARIQALANQINPHFLFNTLTSITSLIRSQPETARMLIVKLSGLLRRLMRSQEHFVTLREELAGQRAGEHHQNEYGPVVFVGVEEAVVVAQHREDHRQREVGVVHAALLAALAVDGQRLRIHFLAGGHGRHHLALAGPDPG